MRFVQFTLIIAILGVSHVVFGAANLSFMSEGALENHEPTMVPGAHAVRPLAADQRETSPDKEAYSEDELLKESYQKLFQE